MRNYQWRVKFVYIATSEYSEQYDPQSYYAVTAADAVQQSIASGYWGDSDDVSLMAWVKPGLCAVKMRKDK